MPFESKMPFLFVITYYGEREEERPSEVGSNPGAMHRHAWSVCPGAGYLTLLIPGFVPLKGS